MISVIIPILNQQEMSQECISAVMNNTEPGTYEIVVIDNGSNPEFKLPFTGFNELRIIRNDSNTGFPHAINQGLAAAKGNVIILLNNDCIVTPGWAEHLVDHLDEYAIIAPTCNYCAGIQNVIVESYNNIDELNEASEAVYEENQGESENVNFVIGFLMAFKKSLYDELGKFDESLWPCSGEEIDFCFEAVKAGYRVGVAWDVYVHHEGSQTFNDLVEAGQVDYAELCKRNDEHLAEKWGADFWSRQVITENAGVTPEPGLNLNLGCGFAHAEGYINIDSRAEVNPDLVCDIIKGLPYDDNSIDVVRAYDFLEHIPQTEVINVMNEIWRTLKPGGKFNSSTPDAERGQAAFQDPTHCSFWVENSWLYYSKPDLIKLCGIRANFEIKSLECVETGRSEYHINVIAVAIKD